MDVAGRYIAIIVTVILVILFPIQYIASSDLENTDKLICLLATEFSDSAINQGRITGVMHDKLIRGLAIMGELYEITIEVAHPVTRLSDSGEVLLLYDITYTDDIISSIHRNKDYSMGKGDLITLTIVHRNKSIIANLEGLFGGKAYSVNGKRYVFGGEVRKDGDN